MESFIRYPFFWIYLVDHNTIKLVESWFGALTIETVIIMVN